MIKSLIRPWIASAVGLGALISAAQAQTGADTVVQITPYAWATGVGGDMRPVAGGPQISVSKSFSSILQDLDTAFFISAFARHGNLVFLGDFSTSTSSRSGTVSGPPLPGPVAGSAKLRQSSATALAGYRVNASPSATIDLLAGARHWHVRGDVGATGIASATRSVSFTDPILAARANLQLAPGWSSLLYADIGGFGVGSRSTAQVLGTVNYELRDNTFLSVGFRHLQVDYRSGGARFDMRMGGPIVGASFRF